MKKTLAVAILFLSAVAGHGQIKRITFGLAGNHPIIPSVQRANVAVNTPVPYSGMSAAVFKGSVKESFEGAVGMNFSGNIDYALSERIFITAGLGVSYLHYKRTISVGLPEQDYKAVTAGSVRVGAPMGSLMSRDAGANELYDATPVVISSPKAGQTSVIHLQMPVMAGTSFLDDRLFVRGGATFSWLMTSRVYKPHYAPGKGIEEVRETSNESFSPLLVAATVNVSYAMLKRFTLDAIAQQYFTPIYKADYRSGGNARYTVISLGVSYVLPR